MIRRTWKVDIGPENHFCTAHVEVSAESVDEALINAWASLKEDVRLEVLRVVSRAYMKMWPS